MDNQPAPDVNGMPGRGTVAAITDEVEQQAARAKEAVADFGRKTIEGLHHQGDALASGAHATADKLQATADYVRTQDVKAMANDVGELVRRYPGPALAIAATAGFIAARLVRSRA